jgi:hypothetical protein
MSRTDYASSWEANAVKAIWNKIKSILNTSAIIDPSGFNKNLAGMNITNPQQLANAIDQMTFSESGSTFAPVSIPVVTSGTTVNFATPFAEGVSWDILAYCYDPSGNMVAFQITNRSLIGFEIYPATNAQFVYQLFTT